MTEEIKILLLKVIRLSGRVKALEDEVMVLRREQKMIESAGQSKQP